MKRQTCQTCGAECDETGECSKCVKVSLNPSFAQHPSGQRKIENLAFLINREEI